MKSVGWFLAAATAIIFHGSVAHAEISGNVIKIGVLTDMSSIFADVAGPGSVEAAKLAVEKLGGKIAGTPVEIIYR